jgi:RHS repeat-associated protein
LSNKSGTSEQIISLPKGGGAMHGIGEKFSPDLHTGTGNFTVPIALPPGRNGFQPQLNLIYSTGNGNGFFGLGWGLSIPGVSRKTWKGVPRYQDADQSDAFILSGAEDLVQIRPPQETKAPAATTTRTAYRPRTEDLFARIEHCHVIHTPPHTPAWVEDYWEVRSKDGLVSYYGAVDRSDPTLPDSAVLANPDRLEHIFAWKLTLTKDPFGNRIEYIYERERTDQADEQRSHHSDQPRLKQIRYADYTSGQGQLNFLVIVDFEYEDREDRFSDYRAGFEIRTTQRCKSIAIETHFDQTRKVRTYQFAYDYASSNKVSLLKQVEVIGYDDQGNPYDGAAPQHEKQLPPLTLNYSIFDPTRIENSDLIPITGQDVPPASLGNPDYELVDLTGDGLPDVLEMNGAVRYWRNLGAGRFDLPRPMRDAPPFALADVGVQMLDANGNGRADLMVTNGQTAGYFPLNYDGTWDQASFQLYREAPSFNLEDPEVKLVDLDGDGLTDIVRSSTRLDFFFNDPDCRKAWTRTRWVERKALDVFPNVNFSDQRVKWGDMTGDGLQDIVLVYDGNVEYWPNLGHGNWGKRIHMQNSPRFRDYGYTFGYDPRRILIGDVDGDGCADIVYVDNDKVVFWINRSGNSWSDPIEMCGTPPVTDMDSVRLVDFLGSGIVGVLWSADANSSGRPHMYFLDLTGGVKPYLLNEMNNQLGAVTKVQYAPSTQFYLQDQKHFATRWKTSLPFPVQVVARVEVIDEISQGKLTTEYRYHHGYWDGAEREFRGFGMVEQLDTETFDRYNADGLHGGIFFQRVDDDPNAGREREQFFSPPTLTRTWFHVGPVGPEFGEWYELDLSSEYWKGDPALLDHPGQVNKFLRGLRGPDISITRRMQRDALRTLRGSILRTELYALDREKNQRQIGTADRPYVVSEQAYELIEVPAPGAPNPDYLRIFFPHLIAQRTTQWERGNDPLTRFTFTGDYDAYGQPQATSAIACPRGWRSLADRPALGYLATRTRTDYAGRDDANHFMVDRIKRSTTYEYGQANTVNKTVFELRDTPDGDASLICFAQVVNAFDGLDRAQDYGTLGDYGAITATETLALTEKILDDAYGAQRPPYLTPGITVWTAEYPPGFRQRIAGLPGKAGYIYHDGIAAAHYQPGYFIRTRRRYDFQNDPARARGLVVAKYDPLENITIVDYAYQLLPIKVEDAARLVTTADYNYRVLLPVLVADPNGNRTAATFTPLGLPASITLLGKENEPRGDRRRERNPPNRPALDYPSTWFEYNFRAFTDSPVNKRQPIFIRTIKRQEHFWDIIQAENERRRENGVGDLSEAEIDALFPINELQAYNERFIEVREYSDGFGRLLQTRTQGEDERFGEALFGGSVLPADPADVNGTAALVQGRSNRSIAAPNVVVSGWQTYDNKGREVEKFEPFFEVGWDYDQPSQAYLNNAQKAQIFYDPLGRAVRTVNPDGSEQCVIYGSPLDQANFELAQLVPSPWEVYTYDVNDNAGRTHAGDPRGLQCQHQWNTPTSTVIDALGRSIMALERNRKRLVNGNWSPIEIYRTTSIYDIRGNLLVVADPLGRTAFTRRYDLTNRGLQHACLDGGSRLTVFDAAGNLIEHRDAKGALELSAHDALNRVTRLWARDNLGVAVTMRQRLIYGDASTPGLTRAQALARNLLSRLYRHYDEAGLMESGRYDFKGNQLERSRRTIRDTSIANSWVASWDAPGSQNALEPAGQAYRTSALYDALNRLTQLTYPAGTAVLRPIYNRAGALERVDLDGENFVERIAYNAKGQRTLVVYANGLMTRYAYDPQTFRLARLRTERCTSPGALQYRPAPSLTPAQRQNNLLQDLAYTYDPVGNLIGISDRTPNAGLPAARDRLDRAFVYDPLYRLTQATGRECDIQPNSPWDDAPRCTDITRTRPYVETYAYDPAGNMLFLSHGGLWTRNFGMAGFTPRAWQDKVDDFLAGGAPDWGTDGNRMTNVGSRTQGQTHFFDTNGNLTSEGISRRFTWNHADQLVGYTNQAGAGAVPSVEERYLYDAAGMRIKKWTRTNQTGTGDSAVYIGSVFEHRRWREVGRPGIRENFLLHVMDNQSRMAVKRVGDVHSNDRGPDVEYHLGDHLGSSSLVTGGANAQGSIFINREEYYPYGETSFGSFGMKHYRFTGKERDERTGLYYHGARYYAPWLARWVSCDPLGAICSINLFQAFANNPLNTIDPTGLADAGVTGTSTDAGVTRSSPDAGVTRSSPDAGVTRSSPDAGVDAGVTRPSPDAGVDAGVTRTSSAAGVTVAQLSLIFPTARPADLANAARTLNGEAARFGLNVNDPTALAHFLAQVGTESNLQPQRENLTYTNPDRLVQIFPRYFRADAGTDAGSYVRQPVSLGNLVYDNRMGNDAGQGYSYRGGGLIQTTGFNGFSEVQKAIDTGVFGDAGHGVNVLTNPDQINQGDIPMLSALYYWQQHVVTPLTRDGGLPDVRAVTRAVNGGENGLAERTATFNRALGVLSGRDAGP